MQKRTEEQILSEFRHIAEGCRRVQTPDGGGEHDAIVAYIRAKADYYRSFGRKHWLFIHAATLDELASDIAELRHNEPLPDYDRMFLSAKAA